MLQVHVKLMNHNVMYMNQNHMKDICEAQDT